MKRKGVAAEPLMRTDDVAAFIPCSRKQISLMVKAGLLPRPVYVSKSQPRWRRADLEKWYDRLAAEQKQEVTQ